MNKRNVSKMENSRDRPTGGKSAVRCMFSRNLSAPDFVRRFFVGCGWRKISYKGRCMKDSERTYVGKGGKSTDEDCSRTWFH